MLGEAGFVGAEGGVGAGEVDVVADRDEGALLVCGVEAAGGVGEDEGLAAEQAEDAGGKRDLRHRVALVGVNAAGHDGDWRVGDGTQNELAGVAFYGALRPVGDFTVGDGGGVLDLSGEVTEAGAEDEAEGGFGWVEGADVAGGGLGAGVEIREWHVSVPSRTASKIVTRVRKHRPQVSA